MLTFHSQNQQIPDARQLPCSLPTGKQPGLWKLFLLMGTIPSYVPKSPPSKGASVDRTESTDFQVLGHRDVWSQGHGSRGPKCELPNESDYETQGSHAGQADDSVTQH